MKVLVFLKKKFILHGAGHPLIGSTLPALQWTKLLILITTKIIFYFIY